MVIPFNRMESSGRNKIQLDRRYALDVCFALPNQCDSSSCTHSLAARAAIVSPLYVLVRRRPCHPICVCTCTAEAERINEMRNDVWKFAPQHLWRTWNQYVQDQSTRIRPVPGAFPCYKSRVPNVARNDKHNFLRQFDGKANTNSPTRKMTRSGCKNIANWIYCCVTHIALIAFR